MKRLLFTLFTTFIFSVAITAQSNGISKDIKKTTLKVFPNPAKNIVNVLGLKNSHTSSITILDSYGNIVLRHTWEIKNNALNIPIPSLSTGIYVISIHSKEQQLQTKFYKK
ncbi:T9SS type A sorting domain-containing protein [uncultured Maribacter sp.]|uniref:T9SS type A sorting domain-containing protein n=1 Tax=uncultured Maribacter sp. TaxID=431308 RepID=UPI002602EF0E|nr:T9SS type A sorting domain-containing protein [uncultured Maribacter sp.]